jgi:putative redox protein
MAVEARWQGGFEVRTTVTESGHELVGDEPEALGGANAGPNPFALLQASLANCTIVTMAGEANVQGLPLESISVDVRHKQNLVCSGPNDPRQRDLRITELRRTILVGGDLSEEDCKRLLWAAENCPVSKSLAGGITIRTELRRVE